MRPGKAAGALWVVVRWVVDNIGPREAHLYTGLIAGSLGLHLLLSGDTLGASMLASGVGLFYLGARRSTG